MRYQLQLALDHRPSFKAGSELVSVPGVRRRPCEVYLLGCVSDRQRPIPVVFRPTHEGSISTEFISCFTRVNGRITHPNWLRGMTPGQ